MYVSNINDKQIRKMMKQQPELFPGMISAQFYVGMIRQEMALYEHQANPASSQPASVSIAVEELPSQHTTLQLNN